VRRRGVIGAALLLALLAGQSACRAEKGLVAHYTCDEGRGRVLRDVSGNGNDGQIHGARFVKMGTGYCLEFNGKGDYVDCGEGPSLDLKDALTLEAWVYPQSRVEGEVGILGKHFESFLLSYYGDGQCYWYISSGGNNARTLLTPGSWHHLAGTFDGKTLRLYLDGKLAHTAPTKFEKVKSGKHFLLGCVLGDPNATDPFYTRNGFFPGRLDEVRVYNRALSESEVRAHFAAGLKPLALTAAFRPGRPAAALRTARLTVQASRRGAVEVRSDKSAFVVSSAYSYPGARIGWNRFAEGETGSEPGWSPQARRVSGDTLEIAARGKSVRVRRRVRVRNDRIEFEDTLTNLGAAPVGLIVRNEITAPQPFAQAFSAGGAESPVVYLQGPQGNAGIVVEDDVARLRFEPGLGVPANQARLRVTDLALDAGRSYTLRWSLYLLPQGTTYFGLIDRVRRDWKAVFTLQGPFAFFDVNTPLLERPDALKAYLRRKRLRIAALSPWLDYDPGSFDRVWTRAEYKARMQRAIRALKAADPNLLCLGCIETDWVALFPERIRGGDRLPNALTGGSSLLNAEQTRILDESGLPWRDSVKRNAQGRLELELYVRGGKAQTSLSVYPAVGNAQYAFLRDQVRFLLEEVGMDGFYIDEFSQAWKPMRSYDGWDGLSAEVDPQTGRMGRRYVDCSLAGIQARVNLARYALQRGKIVVANTYATSAAEQSLPILRFAETQASFDPFAAPEGVKPPETPMLYRGALASPIGLGIVGQSGKQDTARRIMRALITYLRHGLLYYHYAIEDIPASGPGSGEYGPINRMFPLTPLSLHEGWIEGRERTITCVSGSYRWRGKAKPTVHRFDLDGREKPCDVVFTRAGSGWKVGVALRDWAEIAVIEP